MTAGEPRLRDGGGQSDASELKSLGRGAGGNESEGSREVVAFESQGVRCEADLYLPPAGQPPWPTVVMAHGFAGARTWGLAPFAERFADAGIAAFVFDYRHLGTSGGTPRRLIDASRQLDDWVAALETARSLAAVNPERLAIWGTSYGAGHALATARREPDIDAVVAQAPFVDGPATIEHQTRGRGSLAGVRMAVLAIADRIGAVVGRGPVEVPIVTEPGEGGLLDSPGALEGFRSVVPESEAFVNRTPARVLFDLPDYRPIEGTDLIDAPVHVVVAEKDRLLPLGPIERLLDCLADPSVHRVPAPHFGVHHDPWFDPVVTEQVAFLTDALAVDP